MQAGIVKEKMMGNKKVLFRPCNENKIFDQIVEELFFDNIDEPLEYIIEKLYIYPPECGLKLLMVPVEIKELKRHKLLMVLDIEHNEIYGKPDNYIFLRIILGNVYNTGIDKVKIVEVRKIKARKLKPFHDPTMEPGFVERVF